MNLRPIARPGATSDTPPAIPRRLTAFPGREESPSFSPDGSRFAFAWNGEKQDRFDIYIGATSGSGSPIRLTSTGQNMHPRWSPDGQWIAWWRGENRIFIKSVAGGPERSLFDADYVALSWSPDSRHLVLTRRSAPHAPDSLFLGSVDSGETRRLTQPPAAGLGDVFGEISPDGSRLAFCRCTPDACDLYVQALTGGAATRLTTDRSLLYGLAWTPDSRELVIASRRRSYSELWRVNADGSGTPRPLLTSLEDLGAPVFTLEPPRKQWMVAYQRRQFDSNIWQISLAGPQPAESRKWIGSTRADDSPRFSPDGGRIAFISDRSGHSELWVSDANGRNETVLTAFENYRLGSPRWSADGRRIVFDALDANRRAIFVTDVAVPAPGASRNGAMSDAPVGRPMGVLSITFANWHPAAKSGAYPPVPTVRRLRCRSHTAAGWRVSKRPMRVSSFT